MKFGSQQIKTETLRRRRKKRRVMEETKDKSEEGNDGEEVGVREALGRTGKVTGRKRLMFQVLLGFIIVVLVGRVVSVLAFDGSFENPQRLGVGVVLAVYFASELYHHHLENGEKVRSAVEVFFLVGAAAYIAWYFISLL